MKNIRLCPVLLGLYMCLLGAGLGLSTPTLASERMLVAVILAANDNAFWDDVSAGAEAAGREMGVDIWVRAPATDNDSIAQRKLIGMALARGAGALVIAPNSVDVANEVALAKEKGIPSVYIDRDTGGAQIVSFVGTDNFQAGVQAAELVKTLKITGAIALFGLQSGIVSTDQREAGFIEGLKRQGRAVVMHPFLGLEPGLARRDAAKMMSEHPELAAVFTPNETSTRAALLAKKSLSGPKPALIGFDHAPDFSPALADHTLAAVIVQQPTEMGRQGVIAAVKAKRGAAVTARIITPTVVVGLSQ